MARRSAKLEQSRRECEALRQEKSRLQDRLEQSSQETSQLQETLQYSKEELHRYAHVYTHTHSPPCNIKLSSATNDNSKESQQLPLFHPTGTSQKHEWTICRPSNENMHTYI